MQLLVIIAVMHGSDLSSTYWWESPEAIGNGAASERQALSLSLVPSFKDIW